ASKAPASNFLPSCPTTRWTIFITIVAKFAKGNALDHHLHKDIGFDKVDPYDDNPYKNDNIKDLNLNMYDTKLIKNRS
ncbi:unnamed protein product, partial [Prorocentrum cordatum]